MAKRKLLLADDSITIQKVVNLTFADEGIDVITVGDGDAAMREIAETDFDIVLADVNMPGLNGYEICRHIRETEATRDMPVVLLVGSFEPFDEAEAARVGANAYMTKPFQSIRQLVSQVNDLLEPAAAKTAEPDILEEPKVESDDPETEDIKSLYEQSVAETVEVQSGENDARDYVDAGMDDEMIEASYLGTSQESESSNVGFAATAAGDYFGGTETETRYDGGEQVTPIREAEFEAENEPSAAAGDMGDSAFAEHHDEPVGAFDQFAETERIDREDGFSEETVEIPQQLSQIHTGSFHQEPEKAADDIFTFDEIDLLELPPAGSAKTIEFTTPEGTIDAGSNKQVVSLSPELMEIIVQKVAEKLSEKY